MGPYTLPAHFTPDRMAPLPRAEATADAPSFRERASITAAVVLVWLLGAYFVAFGAVGFALGAAENGHTTLALCIFYGVPALYLGVGIAAAAYVFARPRHRRKAPGAQVPG